MPAGVVGDGKADDTEAIQKLVDSGAGVVRLPRGVYRLTKPVVIDLAKTGFTSICGDGVARLVMEGGGPALHFIGTHGGTADPNSVKPEIWEKQRMPMVDGIEIVGGHPEADGIEATGTMKLTITRTLVRLARHGIHLTTRNRNVIISDCHLYDNTGAGVFYDNVDLHQSNITGCHISYNAGGGVVSRGGGVRNLQINGCDIEGNMAPDAPPSANVLIDSTGGLAGSTAEVTIIGCTLQHNSKSPGSANILFIGKGEERFSSPNGEPVKWGHLTIANNVISDVMINIHLQSARNVTLTGNSIALGFEHDLIIEDCTAVTATGNVFDRNPRYARSDAAKANSGIVIRGSQDVVFSANQIDGVLRQPAAVQILDCTDINVSGCTIVDCDGPGLLLKNVRDSLITGCLIRDRRPDRQPAPSIRNEGGSDIEFSGNKLSHGTETVP
ncbi:MAG: right-handed parallel beta-helix repeat-containing protein [Verrucomicrobiaceae bacterium]|nr:right-handed parallel beta-helix repeat-containing protein [Verrucomicrobiaceae bacterium]